MKLALVALALGLLLAAARCAINVPLGVTPPSDAAADGASDGVDAGSGD